jgi:hypothetical protein
MSTDEGYETILETVHAVGFEKDVGVIIDTN